MYKRGSELKVGDVINVWWSPNVDLITELVPYTGFLSYLWNDEARIAKFMINRIGMTIGPTDWYKVIRWGRKKVLEEVDKRAREKKKYT